MTQALAKKPDTTEDGPRVGIFEDIPNAEYHHGPGISKSGLDLIDLSPAHYITHKRHPKPSTATMIFGSAFHSLVLEPEKFADEYVLPPEGAPNRLTSRQINAKKPSDATIAAIEFWAQWDAENAGKTVIENKPGSDPFWSPGDWDRLHRMRDAVAEHPIAGILLDPGQGKPEQSVYWVDAQTRKLCKCRPDFLNEAHNCVADLKSTDDASYTAFGKSCAKFRYHVQDPFYCDGLRAAGKMIGGFVFVAVEKRPPWGVACYVINDDARRIGRSMYERNLETYAKCHAADEWPCYPAEVRDLELPGWILHGNVT